MPKNVNNIKLNAFVFIYTNILTMQEQADFLKLLGRALNTWDIAPAWLFELAKKLEEVEKKGE